MLRGGRMRQRRGIWLVLGLALLAAPLAFGQTGEAWPQPNAESLPAGAFKETVLYGRKLFNETYSVIGPEVQDKSMRYSGNNLSCQSCHLQGGTQPDGNGKRHGVPGDAKGYLYPPLWGPDSFNDGAGMHRLIASATFIRANMPFGTHYDAPTLSAEDAWDVAAYINTQERPQRASLDADYPTRA